MELSDDIAYVVYQHPRTVRRDAAYWIKRYYDEVKSDSDRSLRLAWDEHDELEAVLWEVMTEPPTYGEDSLGNRVVVFQGYPVQIIWKVYMAHSSLPPFADKIHMPEFRFTWND